MLPEVERVLTHTDDFEPLWREAWDEIARALESFERGASRVEEYADGRLSVVTLAPDIYGESGFRPTRHSAPYTAISRHARGQVYLIAIPLDGGWGYRVDYPYYSWAETFVRPRVARRDFAALVARLNELEKDSTRGGWKMDKSELASAVKFADERGLLAASRLAPERVAEEVRAVLVGLSGEHEASRLVEVESV